jgi:hypothetical protein
MLGLESAAFAALPIEADEKTHEDLAFTQTVFDRVGSLLNSLATMFDDPDIKIGLLGGSAASKFIALTVDMSVVATLSDAD